MIHKLKYRLLCWLLKDQELLHKLYIKQIVTQHVIEAEEDMRYRFKVEINE